MKRLLIILCAAVLLASCGKKPEEKKISFTDSLNNAYEGRVFQSHKAVLDSDTLDGSFIVRMNAENLAASDNTIGGTVSYAPGLTLTVAKGETANELLYIYTISDNYMPVMQQIDSVSYVLTTKKDGTVFRPYCATKRDEEGEIVDCFGICQNCLPGPVFCKCDDPEPDPEPWPPVVVVIE